MPGECIPAHETPRKYVLQWARREFSKTMAEESTGSNAIWAIALVIIVAMIAGLIYYSGMLGGQSGKKQIDVDVKVPSAPSR